MKFRCLQLFFLEQTNIELDRSISGFEADVMNIFLQYKWPGNLREFRNVVRRAALLTTEGKIKKDVLPWEMLQHQNTNEELSQPSTESIQELPTALRDSANKAEYEMIIKVLKEVNFNKTRAAEILKIDRKTLYNKMRNFES